MKIKWNCVSSLNHNFIVLCELLLPCQLFAQKCSSSLNHNFIVLCELLLPCQLFAQKCSNCQEITKISKCSAPPQNPLTAIGNIHRIFCYLVLLHSFKTIAGGFNGAFWWYGQLSEDREHFKEIYQNYLVALTSSETGICIAVYNIQYLCRYMYMYVGKFVWKLGTCRFILLWTCSCTRYIPGGPIKTEQSIQSIFRTLLWSTVIFFHLAG